MGPDDEVDINAVIEEARMITIPETTFRINQHAANEFTAMVAARERMREQREWRVVEREVPGFINTGRGPAIFVNTNGVTRINLGEPVPAQSRHGIVSTAYKCRCGSPRKPIIRDLTIWGIPLKEVPVWTCEVCGSDFLFVREPNRGLLYTHNNVKHLFYNRTDIMYEEFLSILYEGDGRKFNEQL